MQTVFCTCNCITIDILYTFYQQTSLPSFPIFVSLPTLPIFVPALQTFGVLVLIYVHFCTCLCHYRQFGYTEATLQNIVNKLVEQLGHRQPAIRQNSLATLLTLGLRKTDIVSKIVPMLSCTNVRCHVVFFSPCTMFLTATLC